MTGPSVYLLEWHHGILASIRHHLKKNRFTNFEPLKEAFAKLDKVRAKDKGSLLH